MGIIAAVRTALFAAQHPHDSAGRILAVAKSNVGRRPPALGFRIVEAPTGQPVIEWTGPVNRTSPRFFSPMAKTGWLPFCATVTTSSRARNAAIP